MAVAYQVGFIKKSELQNAHERVTHIGGTTAEGNRWTIAQPDAIAGIEKGKWNFWVSVNEKPVWVIVAVGRYGHKYLKTLYDGEQPEKLLGLPEGN